jgi:hypothetical protein
MHQVEKSGKFLEADIKALTLNYLRDKKIIDQESIIMNELTLGKYIRRVDLAIFIKGKLVAFEIKSEADSLYRLDGQIDTYLEYFDKVIVVSDSKFIPKLINNLPEQVGIWEVSSSNIDVQVKGRLQNKIDKTKLIDYMDVVDLIKLSSKLSISTDKDRVSLENSLINASNKALRNGVELSLKRKFKENNLIFLEQTKNKIISKNDLKLLSRFNTQREKVKLEVEQRDNFWKSIDKHAAELTEFVNSAVHTG